MSVKLKDTRANTNKQIVYFLMKNKVILVFFFLILCGEDASTTSLSDLLLGAFGEELGLDNDGLLGESALAEDLEVTGLGDVDHRDRCALLPLLADVLRDEGPDSVDVNGGAVVEIVVEVEVSHAVLAKVPGVTIKKKEKMCVLK